MLGPLKANVDISKQLAAKLKDGDLKKMAKLVSVSSTLILNHANDLLDYRILQLGTFEPVYSANLIMPAIKQIIDLMSQAHENERIQITCDLKRLKNYPVVYFDTRRLQ